MKLNEKKISDFFKIINEKKIKSVFQPIVSLKTGEIVSFEALSRITLESCPINIEELFKIANMLEQSWKLDQLCRKCAIKASQQMPLGKKLFINVDANILLDQDFVQGFTKEYLKKYHLDSNNIVFELSETTSIEDKHLFKQAVRHYRSQGFEIAIDDVGSGYSNLNRINHTQPEYLKLDRELIQDIHLNKDKHTMVEVMVIPIQVFAEYQQFVRRSDTFKVGQYGQFEQCVVINKDLSTKVISFNSWGNYAVKNNNGYSITMVSRKHEKKNNKLYIYLTVKGYDFNTKKYSSNYNFSFTISS